MRAVIFPGQGSQYVGMGSDFYNKFDTVKKIFKTADQTLGFSLTKLILEIIYLTESNFIDCFRSTAGSRTNGTLKSRGPLSVSK